MSVDPATALPPHGIIELCATPMAWIDGDLVLQRVNPALCDWLGQGVAGVRGLSLDALDARPPQLAEGARRALREERRVWLRESRLRSVLGDRTADVALTPQDGGLLLELLPCAGEVAAGTRLTETLRGFAHEVRGPLAGMRGAAQLLQRRLEGSAERELAQLVIDEVDRLAALSERLLVSGGKPRLAMHNVHEILERVAALATADIAAVPIRRDYDPSLPAVRVDADRVQQALLNLVHNAQQAGATCLSLRTRIERDPRLPDRGVRRALRIEVGDDGCGVPAELAQTLFEPLVSGRADGHGLGLAIAREIAHEHGGMLAFTSRPGATWFSLLLPVGE
ncbi:MAG: PAS domain-containing sensor histidine kinase [Dokdonella sp.]|uniref:two-component system sensor histidine kinase NtrB n=1 Tax=Dokdonella sp. TaxID=2291710 RepID=UPI0025BEE3F8|nr:ATP-binding protein [Dokdonella sp.]MBZ0222296.1 PAS domain-containing sensor histidine kinase [Dokdonella sp.]